MWFCGFELWPSVFCFSVVGFGVVRIPPFGFQLSKLWAGVVNSSTKNLYMQKKCVKLLSFFFCFIDSSSLFQLEMRLADKSLYRGDID
jgi:hypothetical protein